MIVLLVISAIIMTLLTIGTFLECVTEGASLGKALILTGVIVATIIVIDVLFTGGYNLQ